MRSIAVLFVTAVAVFGAACGSDRATTVRMDYPRGDLYDAPFPGDDLRGVGVVDLDVFPNLDRIDLVADLADLARTYDGFGTTSAIYFAATGPLDPASLPSLDETAVDGSSVVLLGADPASPDYLVRYPVEVAYREDGGPFGAPHQVSVLPFQGIPLRPGTLYVAAVTTDVTTAAGEPLAQAAAVADIAAGSPAYPALADGAAALAEAGIDLDRVAGLTAFTTQDPTDGLQRFVDHARAGPVPPVTTAFTLTDTFDDFCVYEARVTMPVYQTGTPPFTGGGGTWPEQPEVQTQEEARIFVTIPRAAAPAGGFPLMVMSRTGGGGDRPLIDRGPRDVAGGEPIEPGTGPALHIAGAGWAGLTLDGPHGGIRNITEGDEQLLIFNISNPGAIRDNIRQSALELALVPDIVAAGLDIDISGCPGASDQGTLIDDGRLALMGHSMGATIAPLVLAVEPRYGAAILSGAGGSWTENIVHKQSPFEIKPIAESLLGYADRGLDLDEHDPAVNLFQWATEAADPPVYGRAVIHEAATPRHILMFQGIVDTYILPPIANATTLSLGLDLGGAALDEDHPDFAAFEPVRDVLPLVGRTETALPASGNLTGPEGEAITGVVVQHIEGPVEDGHEVMFELDAPKAQYAEFLASWVAAGTPTVPAP